MLPHMFRGVHLPVQFRVSVHKETPADHCCLGCLRHRQQEPPREKWGGKWSCVILAFVIVGGFVAVADFEEVGMAMEIAGESFRSAVLSNPLPIRHAL